MKNIMKKIDFSREEQEFFLKLYGSLSEEIRSEFDVMRERYCYPDEDAVEVIRKTEAALNAYAERVGVHRYSMHMLFLLICSVDLPGIYRKNGIDESYAYNALSDLRNKLTECEKWYNIIGTISFAWFHDYFLMTRLAIGRFQYDLTEWQKNYDYEFGGFRVTKGDKIYKFHIPSSGKMTREMRLDSYRQVHSHFGYKKGEPVVITCNTWLLYKGNREVFPVGSNLADFMDDFDLLEFTESERFENAIRVFNRQYEGDTSVLPRDTTLQRNFINYIEKGGKFGTGFGVILFDGEKIINNKRDN